MLPSTGVLPRWARPWRGTHELLVPLYGPGGSLSGVRARRTVAKGLSSTKELVPADSSVAGLVLANPTARKVLRGELTKPIVVV